MRIGHGFDAHKFAESGELILGGVTIPEAPAMLAHSDGDVLIHALCDAILGALAMNDIGCRSTNIIWSTQYQGDDNRENGLHRSCRRHFCPCGCFVNTYE